jgi:hypothetical protein
MRASGRNLMLPSETFIRECPHCGKSVALIGSPPERLRRLRCPQCFNRFWFCKAGKVEEPDFVMPDNADQLMDMLDNCLEAKEPIPQWLLQEIEESWSEVNDD